MCDTLKGGRIGGGAGERARRPRHRARAGDKGTHPPRVAGRAPLCARPRIQQGPTEIRKAQLELGGREYNKKGVKRKRK